MALAEKAKRARIRREREPDVILPEAISSVGASLVLDPSSKYSQLMLPKRYKVLKGGRGGAKSWQIAEALVRLASSSSKRILCTRETQTSIEDSVHHLIVKTIHRLGWRSWFHITKTSITSKSGATFKFRGLHDTSAENIKSFESADIVWVEEARNVSKSSWKFLTPTVRAPGSEIWISYNPENDDDPVEELVATIPPEDLLLLHINFDENPFFTEELEKERQMALRAIEIADNDSERKQAQSDYDHVWLGQFKKINEALILAGKWVEKAFDPSLREQAAHILYGADFGFAQDANTLISSFIIRDGKDEDLYIEHEAYGVGVELDEMEEFYESVPSSKQWPIKADSARPETISHIRRRGFNITAADKWPGSVEDGIAHLRGFRRIYIHPRCRHTIDEAKQYAYKRDRLTKEVLPVIVDKFNHCWDAIRYSLDKFIQRRGHLAQWEKLAEKKDE